MRASQRGACSQMLVKMVDAAIGSSPISSHHQHMPVPEQLNALFQYVPFHSPGHGDVVDQREVDDQLAEAYASCVWARSVVIQLKDVHQAGYRRSAAPYGDFEPVQHEQKSGSQYEPDVRFLATVGHQGSLRSHEEDRQDLIHRGNTALTARRQTNVRGAHTSHCRNESIAHTVDLAHIDSLRLKQLLEDHAGAESVSQTDQKVQLASHDRTYRLWACSPVATPMVPFRPARILAWPSASSLRRHRASCISTIRPGRRSDPTHGAVGSSMNQRLLCASFFDHSMA